MCGPGCYGTDKSSNHQSYSQKKTPSAPKSYSKAGRRTSGATYAGSGFGKPSVKSSLSFGSGKKKY